MLDEKNISTFIFLFAKDYTSNDDVGVARGTAFQELRPGAGFKTGDFVKEKLGGAIVERLRDTWWKYSTRKLNVVRLKLITTHNRQLNPGSTL